MFSQVVWNSGRSLPIVIAVGLSVIAAVAWLYPAQVKELGWRWRIGLPALRAAGMLALVLALLKPAILRPTTRDEQGAVVLLVDRSRSMSVTDNARSPAQLVALADGLGRLPVGRRNNASAAVVDRAADAGPRLAALERAWGEFDYARVAGRGVEAAGARVEASSTRLRESIGELSRAAEALGVSSVRERVAALPGLPALHALDALPRLGALRTGFDAISAAAIAAQRAADERLYQSDEAVRSACDELAQASRFSLVEKALAGPTTGLLSVLGSSTTVVGFAFADDLIPVPIERGLADPSLPLAETKPATSRPAVVQSAAGPSAEVLRVGPDGRQSDVAGAVRKALERFENRDVAAVILFSDGRQSGANAAVVSGLAASGVPVYPVAVAPPGALRDVAIGSITAPVTAFVGESATVRAEVQPTGIQDGQVRVTLTGEGLQEQVQIVKFSGGRPAVVEFPLKLDSAGAQSLAVTIAPFAGETTAENNQARRWIKVLSQRVKVAAYAALPGWDYQYLRNALTRTKWVELQAAVLNPVSPRLPISPEEILRQDVLTLADVPVAALDDAQWGAVYRMVSERGGSVVLLAGASHVPVEYGPHLVASSFLPYPGEFTPTWRLWPGEEAMFRLSPHPDFLNDPALRIGAMGGLSGAQRWQMLPGFFRVMTIDRLKPSAQSLLVESSSGEPVLTQMRVGSGRSFLFGANETWRWRSDGDAHDRFWLQFIRYAAGEPYAARSERLALDIDKVSFDSAETALATFREFRGVGADGLRLEVLRDGKPIRTLAATPVAGEAGRYRARVATLGEGDYQLRLSEVGDEHAAGAVSVPLHVTSGYESEMGDVSGDDSVLSRLAESSGGQVYDLEQMAQLGRRVNSSTTNRPRFAEQRLWDDPYLFVLVVACFAAEWAARKRLGLA